MNDKPEGRAKSPHAFMAEAIGVQARLVDQRRAFLRAALTAEEYTLESGQGYRANDVDVYFNARAAEKQAPLPSLQPWRK